MNLMCVSLHRMLVAVPSVCVVCVCERVCTLCVCVCIFMCVYIILYLDKYSFFPLSGGMCSFRISTCPRASGAVRRSGQR